MAAHGAAQPTTDDGEIVLYEAYVVEWERSQGMATTEPEEEQREGPGLVPWLFALLVVTWSVPGAVALVWWLVTR